MRGGGLRLLGPGARCSDFDRVYRPEPTLVPAVPFDPLSLTSMQQAALLQMHESVVKRSLIRTLLEDSQDKPGPAEYHALGELGLCERKLGKRYHDVTAAGLIAARELERKLCQIFDIHLMLAKGSGEWEQRFACSCGQWSVKVRRSTTSDGNARRSFNRHLVAAKPQLIAAEG